MSYLSSQCRLGIVLSVLGILLLSKVFLALATDSSLAPIRIAPERRQLIGLKFATVSRKDVSDRMDTTGSIDADERLQGHVQSTLAGLFELEFANSTSIYVRLC